MTCCRLREFAGRSRQRLLGRQLAPLIPEQAGWSRTAEPSESPQSQCRAPALLRGALHSLEDSEVDVEVGLRRLWSKPSSSTHSFLHQVVHTAGPAPPACSSPSSSTCLCPLSTLFWPQVHSCLGLLGPWRVQRRAQGRGKQERVRERNGRVQGLGSLGLRVLGRPGTEAKPQAPLLLLLAVRIRYPGQAFP